MTDLFAPGGGMADDEFDSPLGPDLSPDLPADTSPFGADIPVGQPRSTSSNSFNNSFSSIGEELLSQVPAAPERPDPAGQTPVYFDPTTKRFAVNGFVFDEEDYDSALRSTELLGRPARKPAEPGNWRPLSPQVFSQYIEGIRDPGAGRLFSKNFGRGVDTTQLLLGRGAQFLGFEDFGQGVVEQQEEDLRRTSPFDRKFTDIDSAGGALDWFVANLGLVSPSILETVLSGGVGALAARGAVRAGVGGKMIEGGAKLAEVTRRPEFARNVRKLSEKYAAGERLTDTELGVLRNAAALSGATLATVLNGYRTGVSDIYGEMRETVGEDGASRILALAGGVPYAAFDAIPEFLAASVLLRGLRGGKQPIINRRGRGVVEGPDGRPRTVEWENDPRLVTGLGARTAEYGKRFGTGAAAGGLLEGSAEAGQEGINVGLASLLGAEYDPDELVDRFVNSFAAGAGAGSPIGGLVNLRGPDPADILADTGLDADTQREIGEGRQRALPAPETRPTDRRLPPPEPPLEGEVLPDPPPPPAGPGLPWPTNQPPPSLLEDTGGVPPGVGGPLPPDSTVVVAPDGRAAAFPNSVMPEAQPMARPFQRGPAQVGDPSDQMEMFPGAPVGGTQPTTPVQTSLQFPTQPQQPVVGGPQLNLFEPPVTEGQLDLFAPAGQAEILAARAAQPTQEVSTDVQGTPTVQVPAGGGRERLQRGSGTGTDNASRQPNKLRNVQQGGQQEQQGNAGADSSRIDSRSVLRSDLETATEVPSDTPGMIVGSNGKPYKTPTGVKRKLAALRETKGRTYEPVRVRGGGYGIIDTTSTPGIAQGAGMPQGSGPIVPKGKPLGKTAREKKIASLEEAITTIVRQNGIEPDIGTQARISVVARQATDKEISDTEAGELIQQAIDAQRQREQQAAQPARTVEEVLPGIKKAILSAAKYGALDNGAKNQAVEAAEEFVAGDIDQSGLDFRIEEIATDMALRNDAINEDGDSYVSSLDNYIIQLEELADSVQTMNDGGRIEEVLSIAGDLYADAEELVGRSVANSPRPNGDPVILGMREEIIAQINRISDRMEEVRRQDSFTTPIDPSEGVVTPADVDFSATVVSRVERQKKLPTESQLQEYLMALAILADYEPEITLDEWKDSLQYLRRLKDNKMDVSDDIAMVQEKINALQDQAKREKPNPLKRTQQKTKGSTGTTQAGTSAAGGSKPQTKKPEAVPRGQRGSAQPTVRSETKEQTRPTQTDEEKSALAAAVASGDIEVETAKPGGKQSQPLRDLQDLYDRLLDNPMMTGDDVTAFRADIEELVDLALYNTDSNITTKPPAGSTETIQQMAYGILTREGFFSRDQQEVVDSVVVGAAVGRTTLEAKYRSNTKKAGQDKPWFAYAQQRDLVPEIVGKRHTKVIGLPDEFANLASSPKPKTKKAEEVVSNTLGPQLFSSLLDDIFSGASPITSRTRSAVKSRLEEIYAKLSPTERQTIVRGDTPIEDFFENGELRLAPQDKKFIPVTEDRLEELTRERQEADLEREAEREAQREAQQTKSGKKSSFTRVDDEGDIVVDEDEYARMLEEGFDELDDSGMFSRNLDGTKSTGVSLGKLELLVRSVIRKLKVKPNTFVYKNVADLKARNPELYERAAAARSNGDFATTNAAGYSFGDTIILFSDQIRNSHHARFVVLHETIGHFGLRSIMDKMSFRKMLRDVYENDPHVRAEADMLMELYDMPRLEAIEEAMADRAARIDQSVLRRIWAAIKNFLNRFGFQFADDTSRYWISQARRYVRSGRANAVTTDNITANISALREEGRYSREDSDLGDMASRAHTLNAQNSNHADPTSESTGNFWLHGVLSGVFSKRQLTAAKRNIQHFGRVISEKLQTLDNMALRSEGLQLVYRVFQRQTKRAMALLTKYNNMTKFTNSSSLFKKGPTRAEEEAAGTLLTAAALFKKQNLSARLLRESDALIVTGPDGRLTVDRQAAQRIIDQYGMVTLDEFKAGFEFKLPDGVTPQPFVWQYDNIIPLQDLTEDHPIWKIYKEQRQVVNEAAIDLLASKIVENTSYQNTLLNKLLSLSDVRNNPTKQQIIRTLNEVFLRMNDEGVSVSSGGVFYKQANQREAAKMLKDVTKALVDPEARAILLDDPDHPINTRDDLADIRRLLQSSTTPLFRANQERSITETISQNLSHQFVIRNAEITAKNTVLGSYVPFARRGRFQVSMEAVDENGKPVRLIDAARQSLPYFQMDSQIEAQEIVDSLNNNLGSATMELPVFDPDTKEVSVRTVQLRAVRSTNTTAPQMIAPFSFEQLIGALNSLDIKLDKADQERILKALSNQADKLRQGLRREGTPGWDKDTVRAVAEHVETMAHISAKNEHRHEVNNILANNKLWEGDYDKLERLRQAHAAATNPFEEKIARQKFDRYALMMTYMAKEGQPDIVMLDGTTRKTKGVANAYRDEAKKLIQWYEDQRNIIHDVEGLLDKGVASKLKLFAVVSTLGGSFASAFINLVSLATHSLPYLTAYNPKSGYGGGFDVSSVTSEMFRAARSFKHWNFTDSNFLERIQQDGTYRDYDLTLDEIAFLREQTLEGTLMPAQMNALLGTARGGVRGDLAPTVIEKWMWMFSYTESANRRVTAMAAYRLYKRRGEAAGLTGQELIDYATNEAQIAVDKSQGEYSMFNRPEMARGQILQYPFIFKQFLIITVQMLRHLPRNRRVQVLALIFVMAGLKGLPFADDLMDVFDTLMQVLGVKMAPLELEIASMMNSLVPGSAPIFNRGVLDQFTGLTLSSRLGFGDLLPFTGAFKEGADWTRELTQFGGPVVSGIGASAATIAGLLRWSAEGLGIKPDVTSMESIIRNNPITAIRNAGDAVAYLADGSITNSQGKVVASNANLWHFGGRLLGFYPAIATQQNDVVRLGKQTASYAKSLKMQYVNAAVQAKLDGDTQAAREIFNMVRDWNQDARGTEFFIKNFGDSVSRSLKEARKPTALRFRSSAPSSLKPEIDRILKIHGMTASEL